MPDQINDPFQELRSEVPSRANISIKQNCQPSPRARVKGKVAKRCTLKAPATILFIIVVHADLGGGGGLSYLLADLYNTDVQVSEMLML